MTSIIPIPTTRVGDYFARQRLANQLQLDQLALFRLQTQVSTGQRLQLPSEDAPAALRAINLQRLLDRKNQIRTNLKASNLYLSAAENSLGVASQQLIEIRSTALGVADTVATDEQRQTAIQLVDRTIQLLVNAGNAKMQGRYLFAGSRPQTEPFAMNGQFVEFLGNEGVLRSYVDLERLFDTNLSGTDVFGGLSSAVVGTVDLNPHLAPDTLLSTLNGGAGAARNGAISLSIHTGSATVTSVVDLSKAVTIQDVASLIESQAPTGTNVRADVTGRGLVLSTDSGTIRVTEVAQGQAARELGILSDPNLPATNTIVGDELNPALLRTTPLDSLLGTKATALIQSTNANNDLVLTATRNGAEFNGVTVDFIGGGTVGNEQVTFDPNTKTLTVQVQQGISKASHVAAAINAEGTFSAAIDSRDATSEALAGSGIIPLGTFAAITSGGSGEPLDTASGLILTNAGTSVTLDISGAETVEDALNLIAGAGVGLVAEINATRTGLNVRSRLSGADFTIGENGGATASQLGVRTFTGATQLAAFNRGLGVPTADDPADDDVLITTSDGTQLALNLSSVKTVQEVIDLINNHPANTGIPQPITARLAAIGNGIELVDASSGTNSFTVESIGGSKAAEYLGFVAAGQTQASVNAPDADGNYVLTSADRHTLEADSVFNTLIRLRSALEQGNVVEIGRAIERLDVDLNRMNFARAEIGARLRNLEVLGIRWEDENVQLKSALSQELDVDLVEAISNLTSRQYAFEASLRTAGSMMQLSLLDFI
jgi:flagellin-like hook-associated protein FlgL